MLNLCTPDKVRAGMAAEGSSEILVFADHEQYFYRDYYAWQPDYVEKIMLAASLAHAAGREFIFIVDTVA